MNIDIDIFEVLNNDGISEIDALELVKKLSDYFEDSSFDFKILDTILTILLTFLPKLDNSRRFYDKDIIDKIKKLLNILNEN